jgi:hypothetical protein
MAVVCAPRGYLNVDVVNGKRTVKPDPALALYQTTIRALRHGELFGEGVADFGILIWPSSAV